MKAVRFSEYGGVEVLRVAEVALPQTGAGQVRVRVRAAGINPGEAAIRKGLLAERFPTTFPSGEGSDFAGVVDEVGPGVKGLARGREVLGFTNKRGSHADFVVVKAEHLIPKPANVSWEVAGALFVAGTTAYAAVRAVAPQRGETVVVSSGAGGVGCIAVQLARRAGARVIGLASPPHHTWLEGHGVIPLSYGEGLPGRIRDVAGGGVDAFIDTFGGDYVAIALALGVPKERIDTIVNYDAARKYGVRTDGNAQAADAGVLGELVALVARGELDVPIARAYPLAQVREAYTELERRHTLGKIVLVA